VADYLVGEIISRLPVELRQFLPVISISDPVPCGLAAALSGREDAASVLDRLEHQTSLVSTTGPRRGAYRISKLLRTYLLADLLHRFAVPLILNGDHRPLRYALSGLGPAAAAADPWPARTSALHDVEVG